MRRTVSPCPPGLSRPHPPHPISGIHRRLGYLVLAMLVLGASPAHAQLGSATFTRLTDALQNVLNVRPSDATDWRLGVGPYLSPAFEGSREYKILPAPLVSVRYRDVLRIDNNEVDFTAFDSVFDFGDGRGRFDFGPVMNIDFGRHEGDSHALRGLGDIGFSLEAGGYAGLELGPVKFNLEISQDITNGHHGADGDLEAAWTIYKSERLAVVGAATLTWGSAPYMKSFFGITPEQSQRSGLPTYRPGSGLKDGRISAAVSYDLSRHWAVFTHIIYEHLLSTAADSPLIVQRGAKDQGTFSAFVVYKF